MDEFYFWFLVHICLPLFITLISCFLIFCHDYHLVKKIEKNNRIENPLKGRKILILVSGWKGSGKDTFVSYISKLFDFKRFAFADNLKDETSKVFDVPREHMDDVKMKETPILNYPVFSKRKEDSFSAQIHDMLNDHFRTEYGLKPILKETIEGPDGERLFKGQLLYWTPRALLILEGSTKRSVEQNWWASASEKMLVRKEELIAISDFRYPSEYHRIKQIFNTYEIFTVRIDVPGECPSTDASERMLDDFNFDVRIMNMKNGFEEFYANIDKFLKDFKFLKTM